MRLTLSAATSVTVKLRAPILILGAVRDKPRRRGSLLAMGSVKNLDFTRLPALSFLPFLADAAISMASTISARTVSRFASVSLTATLTPNQEQTMDKLGSHDASKHI